MSVAEEVVMIDGRRYVKTTFPNGRKRYSTRTINGRSMTLNPAAHRVIIAKIEKELTK